MKVGQRFLDRKARRIYKVTKIENGMVVLRAEDGSGEVVITCDQPQEEGQDSVTP